MVVVDGHFIAFRALHSGVNLTAPDGSPTGILQIFISVMMKLRADFPTKTVEVVFDAKGPTHRHKMLESYKATRKPTPEELISQVEVLKEFLPLLGFNVYAIEGFEADDTIFTMVKNSSTGAVIISKDKDLMQLIDDDPAKPVYMYDYQKSTAIQEGDVEEKFGIKASQVRDFLALAGDTSDNIPGVPSVGPKTASKLLNDYDDIDGIYNNIHKIKGKLQGALKDNEEVAYLSRDLTQLQYIGNLAPTIPANKDDSRAATLLVSYGLRGLQRKHFPEAKVAVSGGSTGGSTGKNEGGDAQAKMLILEYGDLATTPTRGVDYMFCIDKTIYMVRSNICQKVVEVAPVDGMFHMAAFMDTFEDGSSGSGGSGGSSKSTPTLEEESIPQAMTIAHATNLLRSTNMEQLLYYNYKDVLQSPVFLSHFKEAPLPSVPQDMMILLWMNNTDGKAHLRLKGESDLELMERIVNTYTLSKGSRGIVEGRKSYEGVDVKVLPILVAMERRGIRIDSDKIRCAAGEISTRIHELEEGVCSYIGYRFNIASTKQLSEALFGSLGMEPHKKIKTGFSTNEESLRAILRNHPEHADLLHNILEHRELTKLLSTYTLKLLDFVDFEGRMHPEYNITGAATGRISANNPNIQSIPVRGEYSQRIRGSFRASSGYKLVGIDYSQVELRILAHLSGDKELVEAFTRDEDIHSKTAMNIFHHGSGSDNTIVTDKERRIAKEVNFSVIYGKTPFGLSQSLEIPMGEASTFIKGYFELYGGVKSYIDQTVAEATESGYTKTILGRIRVIHNISGANNAQLAHAKRSAVNAPIQGSAADIIKMAMIRANDYIKSSGVDAHMIMQIHDELVFEVQEGVAEEFARTMEEIMVSVVSLRVPLKVNTAIGDNWGELK